jgi:hypothetical protein
MWRLTEFFAVVVLALVLLAGCGGAGGGGATAGMESDLAAIDRAEKSFVALMKADPGTAVSRLAAELKAMQQFTDVNEDGNGTLWATIKATGRLYVVINNKPELPSRPTTVLRPLAIQDGQLPHAGTAAIFDTIGDEFRSVQPNGRDIAALLARAGYDVLGGKVLNGTIDDLLRIGEIGVFYLDGHGTIVGRAPNARYLMASGSEVREGETRYATYLDEKSLAYTTVSSVKSKDADPVARRVYGVLPLFVSKYLRFSERSVVFPNTCLSAAGAEPFRAAGAGLFLGWTRVVSDNAAVRASDSFFRLTADFGNGVVDWDAAKERMAQDGHLRDFEQAGTGSELKFFTSLNPSDFVVPVIKSAEFSSDGNDLILRGAFGVKSGMIIESSAQPRPLAVQDWTATRVRVSYDSHVRKMRVMAGSVRSADFELLTWSIEGPNGGPFEVAGPLTLELGNLDTLKPVVIHKDSPDAVAGPRGPFKFIGDPRGAAQMALLIKIGGSKGKIAIGETHLRSPFARLTQLYDGNDVWGSDLGEAHRLLLLLR